MRRIFIIFFIFSAAASLGWAQTSAHRIVAIVSNRNFNDEELLVPKKVFEDNGYKVVIASSSLARVRGMYGATVASDMLIENIDVDDFDAVVFVGGPGSAEYWDNTAAHRIAKDAVKENKVLAAICIAPVTLANAGVLTGKKATVWPSEANRLIRKGAFYTGSAVEVDGDIITANGPSAASKFATAILDRIKK